MTTIPGTWNRGAITLYDRLAKPQGRGSYIGGRGIATYAYRPVFNDAGGTVQPATFTQVAGGFEDALSAARAAANSTDPSKTWGVFRHPEDSSYYITPMGVIDVLWPDPGKPRTMSALDIDHRGSAHGARIVKTLVEDEGMRLADDFDALVGRKAYFDLRGTPHDVAKTKF